VEKQARQFSEKQKKMNIIIGVVILFFIGVLFLLQEDDCSGGKPSSRTLRGLVVGELCPIGVGVRVDVPHRAF